MNQRPTPNATPKRPRRCSAVESGDVVQTLLDFERLPGRYPLALREPRTLFAHTHEIMLLAMGRPVDALPPLTPSQDPGSVKRAARAFIRIAMLRPGSDHYSLLGLDTHHNAETLRNHYRLMIRLTHPDFAGEADDGWPPDAASRINRANDVLGSAEKRREYAASLAAANKARSTRAHPDCRQAPTGRAPTPGRGIDGHSNNHDANARHNRRKDMGMVVSVAALCAALLWMLSPDHDRGSLMAHRPHGDGQAHPPSKRALRIAASTPENGTKSEMGPKNAAPSLAQGQQMGSPSINQDLNPPTDLCLANKTAQACDPLTLAPEDKQP